MATSKSKADVGLTLVVLFLITLVTGVIIHVHAHGVGGHSHSVVKVVHWVAGLAMTGFACWHGGQFWKMLRTMRMRFRWFWIDTWLTMLLLAATLVTGFVKLLSPSHIPHLGLWHYWLGLLLTAAVIVHLVRGIPSWRRLHRIR